MAVVDILGRDPWATGLWAGGDTVSPNLVEFATREYQLELRNSADTLIAFLPNYSNESWTEEVNRPDILSFDYPSRDPIAASFVQPFQVWLRDKANGNKLLQRFRIMTPTLEAPAPDVIHVECLDWLSLLREEWITSFQLTASDAASFADVIDGYLSFQANTKKVFRGTMSGTLRNRQTNTWATNKTVLDAIETIHETVGGQYHVNAYRRLEWKERLGPKIGAQFRFRKNIKSLTRVGPDFGEVINRLYAYGNGSNRETRLNLLDAGEPNEYIEDAASIAAFNIKSGLWRDSQIEDPAELLATAEFVLAQRKDPRISYTVDVADLTFDPNSPKNSEDIVLGSVWWVIDEKINLETQQIVVKIVRRLRDPLQVKLEITNIPRDLSNLFKRLFKGLEELEVADSADWMDPLIDDGLTDVDDIAWWHTDGVPGAGPGNLDEKIEDVLGIDDVAEIATWDTAGDTGTLDDLVTDMMAANPTAVLSDLTPEVVVGLADGMPGTGVKASREDHQHGGVMLIVQGTEPAAADWPQGGIWIDTGTAHGDFFQVWIKTISSAVNNDSKVAIALFEL